MNVNNEIEGKLHVVFPNSKMGEAILTVSTLDVVPRVTKTLLKSNTVSEKELTITKVNSIYHSYVCSSLFRCARVLFSVLPLEEIYVSVESDLLDTSTGLVEKQVILSIRIPRQTIEKINFDLIDPSDALRNFVHNIEFKSGVGFKASQKLKAG